MLLSSALALARGSNCYWGRSYTNIRPALFQVSDDKSRIGARSRTLWFNLCLHLQHIQHWGDVISTITPFLLVFWRRKKNHILMHISISAVLRGLCRWIFPLPTRLPMLFDSGVFLKLGFVDGKFDTRGFSWWSNGAGTDTTFWGKRQSKSNLVKMLSLTISLNMALTSHQQLITFDWRLLISLPCTVSLSF